MRKLRVYFAVAAFAVTTFTFSPSPAFAFWIGPFHFGLPVFRHPHHYDHRHLHMRDHVHHLARHQKQQHQKTNKLTAQESSHAHRVVAREPPQAEAPHEPVRPLLYPTSSLPTMFQNILWGSRSSSFWPIGYETIFSSAFAQKPSEPDQCHQRVDASAIIAQIRTEIDPNTEQMVRLERLGHAIEDAADRLSKSCTSEIPDDPIARLQLMLSQIQALTTAIDVIRRPLQDFEQSLTNQQLARLTAAASSAIAASHADLNAGIRSCAASSAAADRSLEDIEKSVQARDDQRPAVDDLHQALSRVAHDLESQCSMPLPQSATARLDSLEARLDATWRAILSIQVALYSFESRLDEDQKHRLSIMTFAAQD
jgi:hypothetical protein